MKMKVKLNLLCGTLLLAAGTYLSGCTDKGTTPGVPQVSKGEPIQFSVGTAAGAESRTEYVDSFLLNWNVGDQIKIQCDRATPQSANYQIVAATSDQWGSLSPVSSDTMKWGEINKTYTFHAAYPAGRVKAETNGVFSMDYITNQLDTVVSLSNGVYRTNPDMNNAYMMADTTVDMSTAEPHHVRLDFDPIMTTFDITVRAGRYEVATGIINPVTVTGVSVIMPRKINSDVFTYNANEGTIKEESPENTQSVYVGVRNGTSRYVDLHEGETLNLMAFVPPVDMNNGDVKMMVHTTAMDYVLTVPGDQITKQNKYFIQLPDMSPNDGSVNNWMEYLDESTPLGSMSIPAYDFTKADKELSDIELGKKMNMLLDKGVRAFFVTNILRSEYYDLRYHELLREGLPDVLKGFIGANPEEFIFLLVNGNADIEDEFDDSGVDLYKSTWKEKTKNDLMGHIFSFEKRIGDTYFQAGKGIASDRYLFDLVKYDNNANIFTGDWNARFVDTDADVATQISLNKKMYTEISTNTEQKGFTGIVAVPLADENYVNGQYTYSDLLIQSIIDCNFKFRH